jgi:hypothetical protein
LSNGVVMNWTTLQLERWDGGGAVGVGAKQAAIEQRLRDKIGPALQSNLRGVALRAGVQLGELMTGDEFGQRLAHRGILWSVSKARYFSSGRVEILGVIDLREFLRPWLLQAARADPVDPAATHYTGVVIDTRGLSFRPCFQPTVWDASGVPLYQGEMWERRALETAPVLYLSEASDPRAGRAGETPLFVKAAAVSGCGVSLDQDGSDEFRSLGASQAIGEGTVVMVVEVH